MPFQLRYILFNNKIKGWSIFTEQGLRLSYLIDYYQETISYMMKDGVVTGEINGSVIQYYNGNGIYGNTGYHFKTQSAYTHFVIGYTANIGYNKKITNRLNATGSFRFDYDINNVDNIDGLLNIKTTANMSIIPDLKKEDRPASHNIRVLFELGLKYNLN